MTDERALVSTDGVVLTILLVVVGLAGAVAADQPTATTPERPSTDQLVAPGESDDHVWPYTSRTRSVAGRTLALNVVVHSDAERVRRVLVARTDADWSGVDRTESEPTSPWRPAHGSVRYTYVTRDPNAPGRWIRPSYQLAVGTYFGQRTHIRAYPGPSGDWTAIQAHTEYWDWFRVRHTVTGVGGGARFVEADLRGQPSVGSVSRMEHGHAGGGSDGGWTVVDLLPALVVTGVVVPLTRHRSIGRRLALPVTLAVLVLGVRAWGLAAEAAFPGVDPKLFVVPGYLVLAAGPPAIVATVARDRPAARTALLAAVGLGSGIALDAAVVGVGSLPPRVLFHRVALMAALGVVALGVGDDDGDGRIVGAGVVAWSVALVAPLFGLV
ncbi:MAG: hypothetical protein V5A16_01830 [Haloplanus sp.]